MNCKFICKYILYVLSISLLSFFSSCSAYKDLYYLDQAELYSADSLLYTRGVHEARIMPNDILSIVVNSEIKGAADDFNMQLLPSNSEQVQQVRISSSTATTGTLQNYIVDKDGTINFPIFGTLKLSGFTITEAQEYIANLIYPEYISSKPIVNIRQLNFNITVLGEVQRPGLYKVDNGQMTILDALAAAGDMTIYGKRNNVLLVRTHESGELSFHKVDLRDRSIVLNKDIFYLQQNDKLYVHTNKARGNSSRFGTLETLGLSALSVIISVISIVTR